MKNKEVVLAFSGGLDTTYCLVSLQKEMGYRVHAVTVNTGAFSDLDILELEKRALACGAASFECLDVRENYYKDTLRFLLFGNVLKNNTYPLSVSSERLVQAKAVAEHALRLGIHTIVHGSTGAGNDQVRFDMVFRKMIKNVQIITPIRDKKLKREQEIDYLKSAGIEYEFTKAKYSINKGLWGTSVGGAETLNSLGMIPESAWPVQQTSVEPLSLVITFEKGEPVAINGLSYASKARLIEDLASMASPYGIGRDVHVGDTVIGIKGRVAFEAAAPLILIKAHHLLEKHTLSKHQLYWKDQLSVWYGNQLHDGFVFDPVMKDIENLFLSTQSNVSGNVHLVLHPYRFELLGIESPYDLMNSSFGVYGEENKAWSGEDVKGFIRIASVPMEIQTHVNG